MQEQRREMASYRIYHTMVFLSILGFSLGILFFFRRGYSAQTLALLATAAIGGLCLRRVHMENGDMYLLGAVLIMSALFIWRWWERRVFSFLLIGGLAGVGSALVGIACLRWGREFKEVSSVLRTVCLPQHRWVWFCLPPAMSLGWACTGIRLPVFLEGLCHMASMALWIMALYCALIQPLERDALEKVRFLTREENQALREKLEGILVEPHRRAFWVRLLMDIIRPFYRHQTMGLSNVTDPYANVFICNHGEIYGPIAMTLYFPIKCRTWVTYHMLDETIAIEHMYKGTFENGFRFLSTRTKHRLAHWLAPLATKVLTTFDPVPVYINTGKDVLKTINMTVESLQQMDNVLIFPENPSADGDTKYARRGIHSLHTGFISLGTRYHRKTGKRLTFYPVYCDKTRRTITIGRGTQYNPENPSTEEKKRIADYLYQSINAMSRS